MKRALCATLAALAVMIGSAAAQTAPTSSSALFVARDARPARSPADHELEELQVELLTRPRLLEALGSGEIGNLAGAGGLALALTLAP